MSAEVLISASVGLAGFLVVVLGFYGPKLWANKVVSAVYKVAFDAAESLGGIEWLKSEDGIAYRKMLVRRVYAVAPSPLFGIPWKLVVTEERFVALVQKAFDSSLALACKLRADAETPLS